MVHGPGRRVLLGVRDGGGVAVGVVVDQPGVVHVADRAAPLEVDLLADGVVGGVVGRGLVGVGLGQGAHDVAGGLAQAALVVGAAGGEAVESVAVLVAHHVHAADPLAGAVVADGDA